MRPKPIPFVGLLLRRRSPTLLVAVALGVALLLTAFAAQLLWDGYRRARAHGEADLVRLAQTVEQHALRTAGEVDRLLLAVVEQVGRERLLAQPRDPRLAALLAGRMAPEPGLAALVVMDAHGSVAAAAGRGAGEIAVALGEALDTTAAADATLRIGEPVAQPASPLPLLPFARPILRPDGGIAGTVVAAIDAARFDPFYATLADPDDAVALFHRDGTLLAATASHAGAVGTSFAAHPLFAEHLADAPRGTFEAPADAAGTERLFAYAALGDHPLVAAVGRSQDAIFAAWHRQVAEAAALLLVTFALLGAGTWLLHHQLRRLADSRNLLRDVLDAIPVNVSVKDLDGRYVLVNAEHARYLGADPQALVGETSARLVGDDYWSLSRSRDRQVIETGRPLGFYEEPYREKDGSLSRWLSNKTPIFNAAGKVRYLVSVGLDVTARRQAEDALHLTERLARDVIDTALDAFIRIDEAGRILEWNPQAEAVFGWPRSEAVGADLAALIVPPDRREAHRAGLARFCATGEGAVVNRRVEMVARHRDGKAIQVEMAITPMRRPEGWIFNAFVRDITERRLAEEALLQAQKMQAIGQLTGGVAHDFNNLLTVILGGAEFLAERLAGDRVLAGYVASIIAAGERAAALTGSLLAFGRRQTLRPRLLDLNQVIDGLQPLIRTTVGERISLTMSLAPELWQVRMDENQFANALLNLAANARDAMPDGGRLTITTANLGAHGVAGGRADGTADDRVAVTVADTGTGMTPEVQARVFEPFFTTKEVGKGSGLGLSLVYGFVHQSGGDVALSSTMGKGTAVSLRFPRAQVDADAEPGAAGAGRRTA